MEVRGQDTTSLEVRGQDTVSMEVRGQDTVSMEVRGQDTVSMEVRGQDMVSMEVRGQDMVSMEVRGQDPVSMEVRGQDTANVELWSEDVPTLEERGELKQALPCTYIVSLMISVITCTLGSWLVAVPAIIHAINSIRLHSTQPHRAGQHYRQGLILWSTGLAGYGAMLIAARHILCECEWSSSCCSKVVLCVLMAGQSSLLSCGVLAVIAVSFILLEMVGCHPQNLYPRIRLGAWLASYLVPVVMVTYNFVLETRMLTTYKLDVLLLNLGHLFLVFCFMFIVPAIGFIPIYKTSKGSSLSVRDPLPCKIQCDNMAAALVTKLLTMLTLTTLAMYLYKFTNIIQYLV